MAATKTPTRELTAEIATDGSRPAMGLPMLDRMAGDSSITVRSDVPHLIHALGSLEDLRGAVLTHDDTCYSEGPLVAHHIHGHCWARAGAGKW